MDLKKMDIDDKVGLVVVLLIQQVEKLEEKVNKLENDIDRLTRQMP